MQKGFIPIPTDLSRQPPPLRRHPPSHRKVSHPHDPLDHQKKSKSTTSPAPSSNSYKSGMSIVRAFLHEEQQKEATIQAHIEVEQQTIQQLQIEKERQQAL